jgi:G3E family GTPase
LTEVIVPISGSCVCCGSRDKLLSALEDFDHRPGRVVIIETNGQPIRRN